MSPRDKSEAKFLNIFNFKFSNFALILNFKF